jgi:hypothetical protein
MAYIFKEANFSEKASQGTGALKFQSFMNYFESISLVLPAIHAPGLFAQQRVIMIGKYMADLVMAIALL